MTIKNKEPYLIKLDIDGTSTNPDFSTLNQKLKKVLQKLKEQGHKICFTTGRNYWSALPFYNEVGLDTFLVTYNGAYINNPAEQNEKEVIVNRISNQVVKNILAEPIIKQNLLNVLVDRSDKKIVSTSDDIYYQEIFFNNNPYVLAKEEKIVDEIKSLSRISPDSYLINTENSKEPFYYGLNKYEKREIREAEIKKIEKNNKLEKQNKYFFFITRKNQKGETINPQIIKMEEIKELEKKSRKISALSFLEYLEKKDALQLVLEFPSEEEIFYNILVALNSKYGEESITFYFGNKLKAKKPGDKILVPDPTRKIIKIRSKMASKGKGAEWVASYYNIPLYRTIAFGNDVNDIEMMRKVGKGVVMADSDPYLMPFARGITDFGLLNSDGVAKHLAEYFNLPTEFEKK